MVRRSTGPQPPADHRPAVAAQRRERMRLHLQASLLRLIAQQPGKRPTLDDLLRTADVSRGSFYKYYTDTDDLLQAAALTAGDELIAQVHPHVATREDPRHQLALGLVHVMQAVQGAPALGVLLTMSSWPRMETGGAHPLQTMVGANLERGIEAGAFAPMPPAWALDITIALSLAAIHAVTVQAQPVEAVGRLAIPALLRALGVPARTATRLGALVPQAPWRPRGDGLLARLLQCDATR